MDLVRYSMGKTFARNMKDMIWENSTIYARPFAVWRQHVDNAPVQKNVFQQKFIPAHDGPDKDVDGFEIYHPSSYINTGEGIDVLGGVDFAWWIHTEVNNDTPSCKVSFVASMLYENGFVSKDELEWMIEYKMRVLMKDPMGRKMVRQYHRVGSKLESRMVDDVVGHKIMVETWVKKCIELVGEGKDDDAKLMWIEMMGWILRRYNG